MVGVNDALSTLPDLERLLPLLPQDKISDVIKIPDYNHMDILWAKNAHEKVNKRLFEFVVNNSD